MKVFSQVSVDKICSNIAGHINKSQGTQKVLEKIGKNPAIFSAVASFGLASVLRPAALNALPFKNEKDRACSKASAISSGLTDLAMTVAIFLPLNKAIGKSSEKLINSTGTFFEKNKDAITQYNSITNRGFKLLLLAPINFLRMSLIKPLMDNSLKKKKERKLNVWA